MTVAKLRGARERKRRETGRWEGRKTHAELRPKVVREAKRLRRANPKSGERRSYRQIADELAEMGHLNERGAPFNAQSIKNMMDGPMPSGDSEAD
jgi:hypothetical protein